MAMTMSAVLFMGALATLATIGLFQDFGDKATRAVVGFAGSIVWFAMAISSFDVIVFDNFAATASEPIMPLVFLGFGFGAVVALFSLKVLLTEVGDEATDIESVMQ